MTGDMAKSAAGILMGSLLFAVAFLAFADEASDRGLEIVREAERRDSGYDNYSVDMKMILVNKQGDRTIRSMRQKILEVADDGDKSIMVFDEPADVKGTALLTHSHKTGSDDQWVFFPAVKRVKRIASNNKSGSFVASEFAYEDLSSQEVEKYTYRFLGEQTLEGVECFIVERVPVDDNSGYTRQVAWYDKDQYRVLKVEYYDRKDTLLKTLELKGYQQYMEQYWRPDSMVMNNHQTGKGTILEFSDYSFRVGFDESDFNRKSLENTR